MSKGNEIYCGFLGAMTRAQNAAEKREREYQEKIDAQNYENEKRKLDILDKIAKHFSQQFSEGSTNNELVKKILNANPESITIENLTINIIMDKKQEC